MDVKIRGTPFYIRVSLDGRTVRIPGEQVSGGFIAFADGIAVWDMPKDIPVTEEEKQQIIAAVEEKTKDSSFMQIRFERGGEG